MNEPGNLPFAVFVSLYKMIDAVDADRAIETDIPALTAVLSGKIGNIRKKIEHVYEVKPEFETEAQKIADRQESYRVSHAIRMERDKNKEKIVLKKKKAE